MGAVESPIMSWVKPRAPALLLSKIVVAALALYTTTLKAAPPPQFEENNKLQQTGELDGTTGVLISEDSRSPSLSPATRSPKNGTGMVNRRRAMLESLRVEGDGHELIVRFVHSVWNLSPQRVSGVEVGIAVPMSDAHQRVHSVKFDPTPANRRTNGWRQETARFSIDKLDPQERFEISAVIRVTLRDLEWRITQRDIGDYDEIPTRIRREFLNDGENYRLDDLKLIATAKSLRTTEGGVLEQIRRIHDFVAARLDYKRDHRWDDASTVLERGSGSCSEYTYLMISLCRLNGIPARYAGGTWLGGAVSTPPHVDRVFHRWVEVYLPRIGWYPIDPTENDRSQEDGEFYRVFGRLPWSYLTMVHGDGQQIESGLLGWDYRSNTRWRAPRRLASGRLVIDRHALWIDAPRRAPALSAMPGLEPLDLGN